MQSSGSKPRVILCCHILPVKLDFNDNSGKWNATFDDSALFEERSMYVQISDVLERYAGYEVLFIGATQVFVPESERFAAEEELRRINCFPVWIDRIIASRNYQGYCRTILWPVFHNVIEVYGKAIDEQALSENTAPSEENSETTWLPQKNYSVMSASSCWGDYCEVNRLFSNKVVELFHEGDIVWIHGYHLLILPSFLIRKVPSATVGLFLHIPFPSSECFRVLAHREDILKSMLCADLIGFQMYEYTRHFLTCCKRMLGLKCKAQRGAVVEVTNQQRIITVTSSHIGITPSTITKLLPHDADFPDYEESDEEFQSEVSTIEEESPMESIERESATKNYRDVCKAELGLEGKFVFLGIDEIESLTGIVPRLACFLNFLVTRQSIEKKPMTNIVFKQIALTPDARPKAYKRTRSDVMMLVGAINKKFGDIVRFEERENIDLQERVKWYNAADCVLVTPIRGRLNMIPLEYQAATILNPGIVILSEFSTAARILPGALKVNPFKLDEFSNAIGTAFTMDEYERRARQSRDLATIYGKTLKHWCIRVLHDLTASGQRNREKNKHQVAYGFGLGLNFARTGSSRNSNRKKTSLELLDAALLSEAYISAHSRLIVLDYSGTLVETSSLNSYLKTGGEARSWHYRQGGRKNKMASGCLETRDPLPQDVKQALMKLASDPKNTVVVTSADLREEVAHALEDIKNIVLVAENGYVFKMPNADAWETVTDESGSGVWYTNPQTQSSGSQLDRVSDAESVNESKLASIVPDGENNDLLKFNWQDQILEVMNHYARTTNGAFSWKAPSSVQFNYVLADPEWGSLSSDCLFGELEADLAGLPLTVEKGKGFVTVRIAGVNKGAATAAILTKLNREIRMKHIANNERREKLDFILNIGDDIDDEVNFETVSKYKKFTYPEAKIFNTKIGWTQKSTKARFYLDEPRDLLTLMNGLGDSSTSGVCRNFLDDTESMELAATKFVTKQSMLALHKADSSNTSLKTVDTNASPKGNHEEDVSATAWGNVDKYVESWSSSHEEEIKKASGLNYLKKSNLASKEAGKMKKNVSFSVNNQEARTYNRSESTARLQRRVEEVRIPTRAEEVRVPERPRQRVVPHSPSYIASEEEVRQLFGGSDQLSNRMPPLPTRIDENQYDVSIPDSRMIPPTRTRSQADLNMSHSVAANTNTKESENERANGSNQSNNRSQVRIQPQVPVAQPSNGSSSSSSLHFALGVLCGFGASGILILSARSKWLRK